MIPTKCPVCKKIFPAESNFRITCSISCNGKNPKRLNAIKKGISKRKSFVGKNNPNWTGGNSMGYLLRLARESLIKDKRDFKKCECCNINTMDLLIHHKNRNRKNNTARNLKILCNKCHDKEHEIERITRRQQDGTFGRSLGVTNTNV